MIRTAPTTIHFKDVGRQLTLADVEPGFDQLEKPVQVYDYLGSHTGFMRV